MFKPENEMNLDKLTDTAIEIFKMSADKIVENDGSCEGINCENCPLHSSYDSWICSIQPMTFTYSIHNDVMNDHRIKMSKLYLDLYEKHFQVENKKYEKLANVDRVQLGDVLNITYETRVKNTGKVISGNTTVLFARSDAENNFVLVNVFQGNLYHHPVHIDDISNGLSIKEFAETMVEVSNDDDDDPIENVMTSLKVMSLDIKLDGVSYSG
jgi:hypothetical protein